jgi:hypothetical protein
VVTRTSKVLFVTDGLSLKATDLIPVCPAPYATTKPGTTLPLLSSSTMIEPPAGGLNPSRLTVRLRG